MRLISDYNSAVDICCGASSATDLARDARAQRIWRLTGVSHQSRKVRRFRALLEMLAEIVEEI